MSDSITRLNAALEGRYRIERELGEGGMATVYLASDLRHERKVALKVLKPELAAAVGADRFLAEIKTTANLQHPHILPLFDSGEAGSLLFYVMPYVEGEGLRERMEREHQLPVADAVKIASHVAEALDYAHRHGVIHRDIKPANILLQDGEPLVTDFGIALAVRAAGDERLTATGLGLGTPHYMSPEQATGGHDLDPRADVYAIACVLYEMLTGELPHPGSTPAAILARKMVSEPVRVRALRETVPAGVEEVIVKALARAPVDRPTSAREFAEALTHGSVADRLGTEEPSPDAVRKQLARLLASEQLAKSWRLSTLLEFIVEETLGGRGDQLKEARIGLVVFERSGRTYDPAIDPIVRVQMGRLRTKLRSYYASEGAADPIRLDVPIGGYKPTFRTRTAESPAPRPAGEPAHDGDDERIAVLPFANMSDDPDNRYFCDGLTDELINCLARTPHLRVVARTSSFQFKDMARDVRDVGRQLDASKVLEGSVRKSGNRVRVTVQLINVADGCHVWSERYDGELTDIFGIHDDISSAIQRALQASMQVPQKASPPRREAGSFEAYNHYLLGRHHWKKRSEQGLRAALDHFAAAVELDPTFARAHSGMADCHVMLGMSAAEAPTICMPRAAEAATRALQLDDNLAEAHTSLAAVRNCFEWDLEAANAGYERALRLDPAYATTYHWLGLFACAASGRLASAVENLEEAIVLDPLSTPILSDLGLVHAFREDFDKAMLHCRRAIELDPHFHRPFWFMGLSMAWSGSFAAAEEALLKGLELCSGRAFRSRLLGTLGFVYGRWGKLDRAAAIDRDLERLASTGHIPAFDMAQVRIGCGDREGALSLLERALQERDGFAIFLEPWVSFRPLSEDPRFRDLTATIGMTR